MAKKSKKPRKKISAKKIFSRLIIAGVVVFVIYNLLTFYVTPEMSIIAQTRTVEVSYEFEGIISRDEETIDIDVYKNGILDPAVSENQMVKKGALIATYFDKGIDEKTRSELRNINKKIAEIKATPAEDAAPLTEQELTHNIVQKTDELIDAASGKDVSKIKNIRSELVTLSNKKTIEVGEVTAAADTLEGLMQEKEKIESNYDGEKKEILSPVHGIFSSAIDGYEEELTIENSQKLSVSDYQNLLTRNINSKNKSEDRPELKIIDSFKWAVSVCADEETAKTFSVGEQIVIRFSGEEKGAKATIEYISPLQSGKYIITAVSNTYSEYAMTNRLASMTFVKATYTGLYVPVEAIRVKNGQTGVYVKTENTMKYKAIDVLYKDDKDAIVRLDNTKSNALLLYDEIVIN